MSLAYLAGLAVLAAQEEHAADVAEEGRNIIIGMLLTALVFLLVIALGQLSRYLSHRRKERRASQRAY
jgi:hypothetical protein